MGVRLSVLLSGVSLCVQGPVSLQTELQAKDSEIARQRNEIQKLERQLALIKMGRGLD